MTRSREQRTFMTYSGSDILVVIDGKVRGEIAGIKWRDEFHAERDRISGTIQAIVFNELPLHEFIGRKVDIELLFRQPSIHEGGAEEPDAKVYAFYQAELNYCEGGMNVDDITEEVEYGFTASDMEEFKDYTWDVDKAHEILEDYLGDPTQLDKYSTYLLYKKELKRRGVLREGY